MTFPRQINVIALDHLIERVVLLVVVETGKALVIEEAVVSAVVDTGLVVNTHDVGAWVSGKRETREWKESSGDSIGRKFSRCGALESNNSLALLLTVGHLVGVVAHMLLRVVGQALLARGLIGYSISTLKESCLTSLSDRIDTILVQAPGRRNGGVVVQLFATVNRPVVVAVVVHVAVPVVHQAVGTGLLGKGTIDTQVEFITVLVMGVCLYTILLRTPRVLGHGSLHKSHHSSDG